MCDSAELGWLNLTWFQVINSWSRTYFSFCQRVFLLCFWAFCFATSGIQTQPLSTHVPNHEGFSNSFFLFFFCAYQFSFLLLLLLFLPFFGFRGFSFSLPPFLSEYSYILYSDYIPLLYINKYMHDFRKINCSNILHRILSYPIIKSQYLTARGLCSCQDGCAVHISCHFVYIISYMHTLVS